MLLLPPTQSANPARPPQASAGDTDYVGGYRGLADRTMAGSVQPAAAVAGWCPQDGGAGREADSRTHGHYDIGCVTPVCAGKGSGIVLPTCCGPSHTASRAAYIPATIFFIAVVSATILVWSWLGLLRGSLRFGPGLATCSSRCCLAPG